MPAEKILVLNATGKVGRNVCRAQREAGYEVNFCWDGSSEMQTTYDGQVRTLTARSFTPSWLHLAPRTAVSANATSPWGRACLPCGFTQLIRASEKAGTYVVSINTTSMATTKGQMALATRAKDKPLMVMPTNRQ